jgi:hypothetical protein
VDKLADQAMDCRPDPVHRESPWRAKRAVSLSRDRTEKVSGGFGPTPVEPVTVTIDGVTHRGMYYVRGSIVFVQSQRGAKRIQIGQSPPLEIAKHLLSELVRGRTMNIARSNRTHDR